MGIRVNVTALLLLFVVSIPFLVAVHTAGPNHVFGGFLFNPIDGNSYLAKMYQGWRGDWRFTLPYSSQSGDGAYIFIFYIFLGHVARILGIPLIYTFHLSRILGALILLMCLLRFIKAFHGESNWLNPVFTLAVLGSGLGWLVFPFGIITSDFWVAEAYPFLSSFANPHFPLGLGLLLWILATPLLAYQQPGFQYKPIKFWMVGLAALALSIISPFGVVIGIAVLGALVVLALLSRSSSGRGQKITLNKFDESRQEISHLRDYLNLVGICLMWVMVGGLPFSSYYLWAVRFDPYLAVWNAQNVTPSPPFWDLVLSLSPVLMVAILGVWFAIRRRIFVGFLPLCWVFLGILLVYSPIGLQRRFMMGIYIPVVILAGYGLMKLATSMERRARILLALVFTLSLPTNLLLLMTAQFGIRTHDPLIYQTRGESQAYEWIEENTDARALILGAPDTGLFLPAHTGRRVIYGHPFETINAEKEEEAVIQFFQGGEVQGLSPFEFLSQREVDYVFYGPRERLLGDMPKLDMLSPVYNGDGVVIFQVNDIQESGV